jgi:hypothetical protein
MSQVEEPATSSVHWYKRGLSQMLLSHFYIPLQVANMAQVARRGHCPLPLTVAPPLQPLDPSFPDLRLCCVFKGITRRSKRVRKCALIFKMGRK